MGGPRAKPADDESAPARSRKRRPRVIAAVTVAALVLAVAGAWGAMTVRDNRLTTEAQGYLHAVRVQERDARGALTAHADQVDAAQGSLEALEPSAEMLQARAELFDEGALEAFTAAMEVLTDASANPVAAQVQVNPLFDADAGTFVDQYRSAPEEERQALAAMSEDQVRELEELARMFRDGDAELDEAVTGAESTALAIAQHLPDQATTIAADYPEAEEDALEALHTAAARARADGKDEEPEHAQEDEEESEGAQADDDELEGGQADDDELATASAGIDGGLAPAAVAEQIAALPDLLMVFIENADGVRDSHEQVLAER
ncbi:MAG TPA: hypothetical protein VK039_10780, partial [Brevibacterium sp.]|nr:hypothetical protein [Brevibacterium sp.]